MIETTETRVVTVEDRHVLVRDAEDTRVVFGGEQGPAGSPGPVGGIVSEYVASIAIGGHRAVVLNASQQAIYADRSILTHANKVLGITSGAVAAGANVAVQRNGEMTEPSWAWVLDTPIWLSTDGLLTQTPPSVGFSLIVAFPISATKILIEIREPLFLN